MCSAEEDLRTAERHIVALEETIASIVELAADVDRGIIDGWTCSPCLAYSLRVCPALVAKRAAGDLQLLRVRRAELVAARERPDSIPYSELDEIPIGMVKIAPVDYDVFTPDQALEVLA